MPVPFQFALHAVCLVGRMPVEAAVRALAVVEADGIAHGLCDLADGGEGHAVQQLVLHGAVDAFGLGVVLRVPVFGHAGSDVVVQQFPDIVPADVLDAPVGVMDDGPAEAVGERGHGHPQHPEGVLRLQRRRYAPARYALAVGIHDHGQEAEPVSRRLVMILYGDVGYAADPYLVGAHGYDVPDEVGVCWQSVP